MPKVIISGNYFPHRDIKYIENNETLEIVPFPKLEFITDEEIESLIKAANTADMLIVALFGTNADKLERLCLERIHTHKALWTFDSHHCYEKERRFQKYFDTFFIAHSPYLGKFNDVRTEWVPDCFLGFDIDHLKELRLRSLFEKNVKYDVVFPFDLNNNVNFLNLAQKLKEYFQKIGIRYHLGPAQSGMANMDLILKSRIVLNISLFDDFNIRNFEVWGLNRSLLTNKVPDHDNIKDVDYSSTYFFQRNFSDFGQVLQNALSADNTPDTSISVLNSHMLIHRYIEMINKVLGTNYFIKRFNESKSQLAETTSWQT
ncbi:MAG: hypothetical protein JXA96_13425 [Sedimentisphaerales bacterium]|nr:hypothetical protein [Sedimentisphaerales bacterium]